jgi:hypothetical protein
MREAVETADHVRGWNGNGLKAAATESGIADLQKAPSV